MIINIKFKIISIKKHEWRFCMGSLESMVYICMYIVQTRLFSFTSTLHFPSGQICLSLATPASASLSSAQAPLLQSCIPPVICLLT